MSVIEDWYSIEAIDDSKSLKKLQEDVTQQDKNVEDLKSTLSKEIEDLKRQVSLQSREIEDLKRIVQQLSSELISQLSTQQQLTKEISVLKQNTHIKHTNELLEELKILKTRELNLLIREKIPTPFSFSSSTETLLTKKTHL